MLKKFKVMFLFIFIISLLGCKNKNLKNISLESYFKNLNGCFILFDENKNEYLVYNEKRINERFNPCSTFKIPLSLIGLETGVLKSERHIYEWNHIKYSYESWNKNHDLKSAIKYSVELYYQMLATSVGKTRIQTYVEKINYGNNNVSGDIINFWHNSLKISAKEEVEFLIRLYNDKLSFSKTNTNIVKEIIVLEKNNKYKLSGKTGTSGYGLGWFIGVLETDKNKYFFAININGGKEITGNDAKKISRNILKELNLI